MPRTGSRSPAVQPVAMAEGSNAGIRLTVRTRRSWPASLAGQPSSLDGLDRTNCGPQVLIAAITVTAICGGLTTRNADYAEQMSLR